MIIDYIKKVYRGNKESFYKILETNFEDYIWDAKHTK